MTIEDKTKEIVFPWPDLGKLSPNSRIHWAPRARAKKSARENAYLLTKKAGWHRIAWPKGRLAVWIDFYAPDRRRRDVDNLLASCKAVLDGIADAMGVDDRRFVPYPFLHDEARKPGEVRIRITEIPERP